MIIESSRIMKSRATVAEEINALQEILCLQEITVTHEEAVAIGQDLIEFFEALSEGNNQSEGIGDHA